MEDSELLRIRKEKIAALKESGIDLYPNKVRVTHTTKDIYDRFNPLDEEGLAAIQDTVAIAGRLMAVRNFGKSTFISVQDRKGRIQGYIGKQNVGDDIYTLFKKFDVGDIIFMAGRVFRTRTGELTVEAKEIALLSKALQPLPEKWHGLTDVEVRYRATPSGSDNEPGCTGCLYHAEPYYPPHP